MRIAPFLVTALFVGMLISPSLLRWTPAAATEQGIDVYFSPNGGAQDAIVEAIQKARKSIDVQAYYFTNATITKALIQAHEKQGVKVRVVLDQSQRKTKYSGATPLYNAGIPVMIDATHATMHDKVVLIDGQTVITGSFNFTRTAETDNAENLLIIRDHPKLFAAYQQNFEEHRNHAEKYDGVVRE